MINNCGDFGKFIYSNLPNPLKFIIIFIYGKILHYINERQKLIKEPAVWAFYDLSINAPGYDIVRFLMLSEIDRIKQNLHAINVVILPDHDNFQGWYKGYTNQSDEFLQWRIRQIVIPCCNLLPSVKQIYLCSSRGEAYTLEKKTAHNIFPEGYSVIKPVGVTINFYSRNNDEEIKFKPSIIPSDTASIFIKEWISLHCEGKKVVTVTLRESTCDPIRNSNLIEWGKFIESLDKNEYFPVILRDTEKAFSSVPNCLRGGIVFNEPCFNVELRAALYEQSYLNLSVGNGPILLMMSNKFVRFLLFLLQRDESIVASKAAFNSIGLTPGKQLPICTEFQKLIWEDDYYEIIQREFINMVVSIESSQKEQ